jgi:hypothetical protein
MTATGRRRAVSNGGRAAACVGYEPRPAVRDQARTRDSGGSSIRARAADGGRAKGRRATGTPAVEGRIAAATEAAAGEPIRTTGAAGIVAPPQGAALRQGPAGTAGSVGVGWTEAGAGAACFRGSSLTTQQQADLQCMRHLQWWPCSVASIAGRCPATIEADDADAPDGARPQTTASAAAINAGTMRRLRGRGVGCRFAKGSPGPPRGARVGRHGPRPRRVNG